MAAASAWLNQGGGGIVTPTRQVPGSRLKTGLSARNPDIDMDLLSLDGYQKQLLDEFDRQPVFSEGLEGLPGRWCRIGLRGLAWVLGVAVASVTDAFNRWDLFDLMCSGDENGLVSVLKFDAENGKILQLPYHINSFESCERGHTHLHF